MLLSRKEGRQINWLEGKREFEHFYKFEKVVSNEFFEKF